MNWDNDLYKYGKNCICKQYCLHYLYKYERTFIIIYIYKYLKFYI